MSKILIGREDTQTMGFGVRRADIYGEGMFSDQAALRGAGLLHMCVKKMQSGRLEVSLSELYLRENRWTTAIEWGNRALDKLDSQAAGEAYLLLGESYLRLGQRRNAISMLQEAARLVDTRKRAIHILNTIDGDTPAK